MKQSFRCRPIFAVMKAVMQSQYYPSTKPTLIHPPCSILGCIKGIFCMKEGEGSPPAPSRKVKILFTIFHIWSESTFEGGWQTRKAGSTKGKLSYLVEIWSQSTNLLKTGRFWKNWSQSTNLLKTERFWIISIVKDVTGNYKWLIL